RAAHVSPIDLSRGDPRRARPRALEALVPPGREARGRGREVSAAAGAGLGRGGVLGGRSAIGRPLRAAQGRHAAPCRRRPGGNGGEAAEAEGPHPEGPPPAVTDYLGSTPS